ncbi:hypothetical protein BU668_10070 [Staphylococcus chromogenes]|nr:hypothetical protein BU668_10070 [Staphylococcus chromogenes]
MTQQNEVRYFELVETFINNEDKAQTLQSASNYADHITGKGVTPEDIVRMHKKICRDASTFSVRVDGKSGCFRKSDF